MNKTYKFYDPEFQIAVNSRMWVRPVEERSGVWVRFYLGEWVDDSGCSWSFLTSYYINKKWEIKEEPKIYKDAYEWVNKRSKIEDYIPQKDLDKSMMEARISDRPEEIKPKEFTEKEIDTMFDKWWGEYWKTAISIMKPFNKVEEQDKHLYINLFKYVFTSGLKASNKID